MGIMEWLAFGSLLFMFLGAVIKIYSDISRLEENLNNFGSWKTRMDEFNFVTLPAHIRDRQDCRQEIYKDINRLEIRFDKFLETIALNEAERRKNEDAIKSEIRSIGEKIIRVLTYLDKKEIE